MKTGKVTEAHKKLLIFYFLMLGQVQIHVQPLRDQNPLVKDQLALVIH